MTDRTEYLRLKAAERRARNGARTGQPGRPATEPCGTEAAYRRGCTCDPCRTAAAAAARTARRH